LWPLAADTAKKPEPAYTWSFPARIHFFGKQVLRQQQFEDALNSRNYRV
jgi:hypothetical protein